MEKNSKALSSVLLGKVFPRQAEVLTTDQWIAGLGN